MLLLYGEGVHQRHNETFSSYIAFVGICPDTVTTLSFYREGMFSIIQNNL